LTNQLTTIRLDGRGTDPLPSGPEKDAEKKKKLSREKLKETAAFISIV
jgi:hypothetical protein